MPKRKTTVAEVAEAAAKRALEERHTIVFDDSEDEALEAEAEALESLRELDDGTGGVRFVLRAVSGDVDRQGILEYVSASEIPDITAKIMSKYGPGKYRVYATRSGRFVKDSNRVITISSLASRPSSQAATAQPASGAAAEPEWMRRLEEREERRRQESREDRKSWIAALAPVLAAAVPALLQMLKPSSMADQAQALVALKAIGESKDPEKMIDLLLKGMELGKGMGAEGSGDSWPALIRTGLTEGAKVIESLRGTPAAGATPPALPAPAAPAPALSSQPAPPSAAPPEGSDMLTAARPLLTRLATDLTDFAAAAADPGLAADALLAKIPSAYRALVTPEQMLAWLKHPDWWRYVAEFHPTLTPYRDFCDQVRQELVAVFSGEPEQPTERKVTV